MTRVGAVAILFLLIIGTRLLAVEDVPHADATMVLGFVLVVAFWLGRLATRVGLPSITAYLVMGALCGPHVLGSLWSGLTILRPDNVVHLRILDGAALGLIALTAGGELRLSMVQRRWRSLAWVIACQVFVVIIGVGGLCYIFRGYVPGLAQLPASAAVAAALLLGVTAVAKSPATTIAILQEYHPRGPMSELVLAVTVTKDVVVVAVFTIALAIALPLIRSASGADAKVAEPGGMIALVVAWEVFGSLVLGIVVGWLFRLYGRYIGRELPFVVLAIAFISGALSNEASLSGVMVCMVAGFYVENFSAQGQALIDAVERHSLPLYVVFFTIAGASVDLMALRETAFLALLLVASRIIFTFLATFFAARWAGEPRSVQLHAWSGFVGQAGVTLGFAAMIAQRIPSFGSLLSAIVVAGVAINQLAGPVVFRFGLHWAREIRTRRPTRRRAAEPTRPLQRLKSWTDPSMEEPP